MENGSTIVTAALMEVGTYAPGESISSADLNFGLDKLNRLMDAWNSEILSKYTEQFSTFTLIANHQPHTIGISSDNPDFVVTGNRPERIDGANLVIQQGNPSYNIVLNIRDADWWQAQTVQTLTSQYPTDLYYEPDWPNGSIYLWPIPTVAYPLQLEFRTALIRLAQFTPFYLPPGYWDAVVNNLALSLCPAFQVEPSAVLVAAARLSKAQVQSANSWSPRISTGGDGLPTGGPQRPSFDWRTGFSVGR